MSLNLVCMWAVGQPIAYKLVPQNSQTLLGLEGTPTMTRAGFAAKSLWVTPYHAGQRWPGAIPAILVILVLLVILEILGS